MCVRGFLIIRVRLVGFVQVPVTPICTFDSQLGGGQCSFKWPCTGFYFSFRCLGSWRFLSSFGSMRYGNYKEAILRGISCTRTSKSFCSYNRSTTKLRTEVTRYNNLHLRIWPSGMVSKSSFEDQGLTHLVPLFGDLFEFGFLQKERDLHVKTCLFR